MSGHLQPGATVDDSTTGRHLPALDGVRGLAIAMVLVRHLFVRNVEPAGNVVVRGVTQLMGTGWIGVDLFFVLSGFLITGILYDTQANPHFFRNFYARRSLRIFPLYYAFVLTVIVISHLQGAYWVPRGTLIYLTYQETWWRAGVGYTTSRWANLNHLWSLAIEEQFYLFWPLTLFLLRTRRRIAIFAIAGVLFSFALRCWIVASGSLSMYPYSVQSWTPARLDGLFLGALLAILVRSRYRATTVRTGPWIAGAGTLALLSMLYVLPHFSPAVSPLLAIVGLLTMALTFAGLIAAALPPHSRMARALSPAWLRALGRYSYGLYVYHWTLHTLVDGPLHDAIMLRTGSKMASILLAGLLELAASLGIAMLSFHYFEQPILRWKRYFSDNTPQPKLRQDADMADTELHLPAST